MHVLLSQIHAYSSCEFYHLPGTRVGGTTPLQLATNNNHVDCIRDLILNGADYNAVDETGKTSLYIASALGLEEAVMTHLRNAIGKDILSLPVSETGVYVSDRNMEYKYSTMAAVRW